MDDFSDSSLNVKTKEPPKPESIQDPMEPKPAVTPAQTVPSVPVVDKPKESQKEFQKPKEVKKEVDKGKVASGVAEETIVEEPAVPKIMIEMKKFSLSKETTQYSILMIFNLVYILLYICRVRLMTIFCNLIIVAISLGGILSCANPNRRKVSDANVKFIFINPALASDVAIVVTTKLNQYVSYFRRVVLWQDFMVSTKFTICVYIMGIFFKFIPLTTLLYITFWALYLYFFICKDAIDPILDIVRVYLKMSSDKFEKFCNEIPKMKDVSKEI